MKLLILTCILWSFSSLAHLTERELEAGLQLLSSPIEPEALCHGKKGDCQLHEAELSALNARLDDYHSGRLPLELDPEGQQEMKIILEAFKKHGLCVNSLDFARARGLLNYNEVKMNFARFYQNDLQQIQSMASEFPELFRRIWIPNEVNLAGKSRRETLENWNRIQEILENPNQPVKQKILLKYLHENIQRHLIDFDNPHSWNSHAVNPDSPTEPKRLSEFLKKRR